MSEVVIRVENLSKEYRLGTISRGTLQKDLQSWWAGWKGKDDPNSLLTSPNPGKSNDLNERFWALKDISFDVKKGEIIGIIGKNGAGKSTLLKILSRVTGPTEGTIKVKGRIASLLEVGTGFHPELTGRENVYLNGTILGMTRKEIDLKFDEILDFAEIEKFIDTPVKRYSSGMYVRLAFAVAAHLDPEILIVDEVLAVGDAAFQKKCLGKMGEVAEGGRTVLFVSHNMSSIRQLCSKGILLENGHTKHTGNIEEVIQFYLQSSETTGFYVSYDEKQNNNSIHIKEIAILNENGNPTGTFFLGDDVKFQIKLKKNKNMSPKALAINIKTSDGLLISNIHSQDGHFSFDNKNLEETIDIIVKNVSYYPGNYFVTIVLKISDDKYIFKNDCLMFSISQHETITQRPLIRDHGLLFLNSEWKHSSQL